MAAYSIELQESGAVLLVLLRGSFDSEGALHLERALSEAIDRGHAKILLDCSSLDYLSSSGIGAIMAAGQRIRDRRGELKLCSVSASIRRLFQYLGLEGVYEMHVDAAEATRSFA